MPRFEQQPEFLTREALTINRNSGSAPVISQQLLRDEVWHVVCADIRPHERENCAEESLSLGVASKHGQLRFEPRLPPTTVAIPWRCRR